MDHHENLQVHLEGNPELLWEDQGLPSPDRNATPRTSGSLPPVGIQDLFFSVLIRISELHHLLHPAIPQENKEQNQLPVCSKPEWWAHFYLSTSKLIAELTFGLALSLTLKTLSTLG